MGIWKHSLYQLIIFGGLVCPFVFADAMEIEICCVAIRTQSAPAIDGSLDEWKGLPGGELMSREQVVGIFDWLESGGVKDISGRVILQWDEHNLYIGVEVIDDVHYQQIGGSEAFNQDSVQFAVDAGFNQSIGTDSDNDYEFQLCLAPEGPQIWCHHAPSGQSTGKWTGEDVKLVVVRDDIRKVTTYECALPLSAIKLQTAKVGTPFGFSILINDSDNDGKSRGWIELGSGIGFFKSPSEYLAWVFSDSSGIYNKILKSPKSKSSEEPLDKLYPSEFPNICIEDDTLYWRIGVADNSPSELLNEMEDVAVESNWQKTKTQYGPKMLHSNQSWKVRFPGPVKGGFIFQAKPWDVSIESATITVTVNGRMV